MKTEHCRSRVKLQCVDLQPPRSLRRSIAVHFFGRSPRRSIAVHFCLATFAPLKPKTHTKMAGKTKEMSQIKQMLLLKKQGVSNRKIATAVGMNKETVNNYMKKVNADSLSIMSASRSSRSCCLIWSRRCSASMSRYNFCGKNTAATTLTVTASRSSASITDRTPRPRKKDLVR